MALSPLPDDTQPTSPIQIPHQQAPQERWRWVLPLIIIVTVGMLVISIPLLLWSIIGPSTTSGVSITVNADGTTYETITHAQSVRSVLRELGLTLREGDTISPPSNSAIEANQVVYIERARQVTLAVNGETLVLHTTLENPLDILNLAEISLTTDDYIQVDGTRTTVADLVIWPVPVNQIMVRHAVTLTVEDHDDQLTIQTTAQTVGEALFEAGITLFLADDVTPDINTSIESDLVIMITRSSPVTIVADGLTIDTRTQGKTVASALATTGITLSGLDYTLPDEDAQLSPGMTIRVIRVTEELTIEQTIIPFQTVFQADPDMELDQRNILQVGQTGVEQKNIRIRFEDGEEVSRTVEESIRTREPLNRVIAYGTNIVLRTVDTPDGSREYWRVLRMYATSYHPEALEGDDTTALGYKLTKGVVSVDPDIIPYLTETFIPNYGVGLAADTAGRRSSPYWIDLGYDDDNWVSWSRYVEVYLLTPVPDDVQYILPEWTPLR